MEERQLIELLRRFKQGDLAEQELLESLRRLPYQDLDFVKLDNHRALRKGFPEVVFGQGKSLQQIVSICDAMQTHGSRVLVTRTTSEVHQAVQARHAKAMWHEAARCITIRSGEVPVDGKGCVVVLTAGTSDIPVAEEAVVTLELMGNETFRGYDVGVAGLHRLAAVHEQLSAAKVVIVAAGMEGALPSVVAGLVRSPVVAVPTSVGYGANFGGLTTLAAMLTSCASGVSVVNIDNGFGAGYVASLINHG